MKRSASILCLSLTVSLLSGCAGLCARKERFFKNQCAGKIAYSDPTCEMNLDRCNDQQVAAFEAYVMCLEALPACSMDTVASCSSAHPAGVNLMCNDTRL